jgi:hypothetical protein
MRKLNKLAAAVTLAVASGSVMAGTFQSLTSEAVGVEASTTGVKTADIAGNQIVLSPGTGMSQDNRLYITLNNGATFADGVYTLEQSVGGAANGDTTEFVLITPTTAGATSLEFRAASAIDATHEYILAGSTVVGSPVTVTVPSQAAGSNVEIDAEARDSFGVYDFYTSAEIFQYFNQFSGARDTSADAVVDVASDRLTFTGSATSDTVVLEFTDAGTANGVSLNDTDKVDIVLSGDMSTIQSIALSTDGTSRGNFTIDAGAGTASFSASASDAFAAASTTLTINVWGSGAIATRSFTVQSDLNFESETDKNLIAAGTTAGSWTINGLQAKVSHLSLNTTGFISWLKVVNEGTADVEVFADIIWTLADGTEGSVTGATLGTVDAGGVGTVGEAAILAAIGNPTQLADVSMTVTVSGQNNLVHLIAEKKASDGRVSIPVYYNNGSGRNWFQ